ncbi:MAG: response regulator [Bacteroidota bacterium]
MQTAKRILLVDDDTDDQMLFTEALTEIHPFIKCDVANDGVEAINLLSKQPFYDLIFLDLNMPRMDGFECLQRIKSTNFYKQIPVVILSTSSRKEDSDRSLHLGASRFFTKPSTYQNLFVQLKGILSM